MEKYRKIFLQYKILQNLPAACKFQKQVLAASKVYKDLPISWQSFIQLSHISNTLFH